MQDYLTIIVGGTIVSSLDSYRLSQNLEPKGNCI